MSPGFSEALLVALGGGAGAMLRYGVDTSVTALVRRSGARRKRLRPVSSRLPGFPWGITLVNLTGSFVIGLLVGMGSAESWLAAPVLTAGVLGGYTTFSTSSLDTLRLWREKRRWATAIHAFGTLGSAVLLAGTGYFLGTLLVG